MDNLHHIIQTFSTEEQREFRQFLLRNKSRRERKDIRLFDLFSSDRKPSKETIHKKLYNGSFDKNAYHSLRKRLIHQVNDFIYLKRIDHDDSLETEINKNLTLVRHLFDHDQPKQAWKHLVKSERICLKAGLHTQAVKVYDLMIQNYNSEHIDETLNGIVASRIKTNHLASEKERLKIVGALVKQELDKVRLHGEDVDLKNLTNRLLRQFELEESVLKRPRLLYDFVLLTRSIILAKKDFYSFEDFVISSYQKLNAADYFEQNISKRLNCLYIVAHTLYRNKKFEEAIFYLEEMQLYLPKVNKGIFNQFYPKYFLLLAACENFSGNLKVSIAILEDLLNTPGVNKIDLFNAQLNLGVYYFEAGDHKKAVQISLRFDHSDKWYEKVMGVEWQIKRSMIESIFQYENGHPDLARSRIEALMKKHQNLFDTSKYKRAAVFMDLLKIIIDDPDHAKTEGFLEKVENSFEWIDVDEEDLQAMAYYGWLKSKMSGNGFYETILELIRKEG